LLATLAWGDGSSSAGTVTAVGGGAFTVTGANTFVAAGSYPVRVAIRDTVHDLQVTVQGTAIVQDATGVPAPQPAPLTPDLTHYPWLNAFAGRHPKHRARRGRHAHHGRPARHRHHTAG
jgi:hypothetical protein